jgi:hypothetical protein
MLKLKKFDKKNDFQMPISQLSKCQFFLPLFSSNWQMPIGHCAIAFEVPLEEQKDDGNANL